MKKFAFLFFLLAAAFPACKPDRTKTAAVNPASAAAVRAQLDDLRDSVDVSWRRMMDSDDRKVGTTRLLLRELTQQRGVDAAAVQGLARANDRLKTLRYDQTTMAESARIDQYDTAQDSLLNALYPVAAPGGQAPTEQVRDFVEGIQQADAAVVGYRVGYDRAAKQFNNYLKLHQDEVHRLGGQYQNLRPLPLFELQQ